jgi:hypothetical protein
MERQEVAGILRETRQPTIDGSVYCESNQTMALLIPVVADVFPQARYVWLMRSGLDVVASTYQKQWYTGHSENHDRYEDCPPLEKAWIDGRIRGDLCGEMSAAEWGNLDRFAKCCWYWSYVNRIIEHDLDRFAPDRFFFVRLEEIDNQIRTLVDWMGLEPATLGSVARHNIAKRVPYHWTEWSATERATFEHWCGEMMDRFYPSWRLYTGEDSRLYLAPAIKGLRLQAQLALDEAEEQAALRQQLSAENRELARRLGRTENTVASKVVAPLRRLARALRDLRR